MPRYIAANTRQLQYVTLFGVCFRLYRIPNEMFRDAFPVQIVGIVPAPSLCPIDDLNDEPVEVLAVRCYQ